MNGTSTTVGDFLVNSLGNNLSAFLNPAYKIYVNGVELEKESEINYVSSTTFSLNVILDIGDIVKIESPL